jgi:glyoxalase-like protein
MGVTSGREHVNMQNTMHTTIDHFMFAVASLDEGMHWAEDTFGVQPAYAGEHLGLGTRNALLSLGSAYLEIIAPDPAQPLAGTLGEQFAQLTQGGLVTWAAEGDLERVQSVLSDHDTRSAGPKLTQRRTPQGDLLEWMLLFPLGSKHGTRLPFFIDWMRCEHPRKTSPVAGDFRSLSITTPDATGLRRILASIDLDVPVAQGEPRLEVSIDSVAGEVLLSSTEETSLISLT